MQRDSTVLKGDVLAEASKLKQEIQREIVVYASRLPVRTLMERDLVEVTSQFPGEIARRSSAVGMLCGDHLLGR